MRFSLSTMTAILLCLTTACKGEPQEDTGTPTPEQKLGLHDALQADLVTSNLGFLWSTDLSPEMVVLREAGTGFIYLSAELAIWGQRRADGQPASLDNCMTQADQDNSQGTLTSQITLDDCFVGANRDRRLDGVFLAEIKDKELQLDGDWNFQIGNVDISGTFHAYWKNINASNRPEATFSLNAVYDGNTYNHRTFSITEGEVAIPTEYETPPRYSIPNSTGEGLGASMSWDNRDDRIDFGLMLQNADRRYEGELWGEYTSTSGQAVPITNGHLEETQDKELILTFSASAQSEKQTIELPEIVQTWGNQNANFNADVSFSYEATGQATLGDYTTSLGLRAYTVTPLSLASKNQQTTLTGAIETAVFFQNESGEAEDIWVFGNCLELTQSRDQGLGSSGTCTFNNANGAHIGLHFSEETPSDGWLLVEKAPNEWICRNLKNGETQDLGVSENAPTNCPN
jgi:hypothetical protein